MVDVDSESTARRRTPGQGGQPAVCAPCKELGGFEWDVLTLKQAEERVRRSSGQLRAFRCRCERPGVWHVLQNRGPSRPAAFSDSGP